MTRLSLVLMASLPLVAASPFEFRQISPSSLELRDAGKPVFVYNHGILLKQGVDAKYRRSSYLHPVYAPDGTVLTDDFPKDHPHHRGICWTWPIVKFEGQTHDVWAVVGMHQRFVRWINRRTAADSAVLVVENGWFVGERKAVKEIVEITVHRTAGNRRSLDFKLSFEAVAAPVEISGREVKGYGGFGMRFAPRESTTLRTEMGVQEKDSDMVKHPWVELEAVFGGRRAGARIEDGKDNPGWPVGWCQRNYGYLCANYPGLESRTLTPGTPLKLSYRVTVFSAT